jgi:predicted cobalt transporter CbtA
MATDYLRRGLLAGLAGGLVHGAYVAFVGNNLIAVAEGFEQGHGHGGAAVSEATTTAVSIGAGVLWGVLFGILVFGVGYYLLEPLLPGGEGTRSYLLGAAGFVTASGAPWLVLPPVAPGVEQSLPTGTRTAWYVGMMALGALVCGGAVLAYRRLADRRRAVALAGAAVPFALLAVPVALAPANPLHGHVPAALATTFRAVVVAGQLLLWGALAASHAWLVGRADEAPTVTADRTEPSVHGAD